MKIIRLRRRDARLHGLIALRTLRGLCAAGSCPATSQPGTLQRGEQAMIRNLSPGLLGVAWTAAAGAGRELNIPRGVSKLRAETCDPHMMVYRWRGATGSVVFAVMIVAPIKRRGGLRAKRSAV